MMRGGLARAEGRESRFFPADAKAVSLAGVSGGPGPTDDIAEMTADQIKNEIQEARNRLALKDQMLCELLRARSAVPKLKLEVRAMVHALHNVRKDLATSNQLVQSLHTQMTFERQKTEELQRLKDAPPTQHDLQMKDARLQELEAAVAQLREAIAVKERERARPPPSVEPVSVRGDSLQNVPRLAARPGLAVSGGATSSAFGRPEHSLTVGTYGRRELDLPFTRSVGTYEGAGGRGSPTNSGGRLSVGGAAGPYEDYMRSAQMGVRHTQSEEDSGQVRFLLGRTATSLSSAQLGALRPLAPPR